MNIYLGFDVGRKKTGVSIANDITKNAAMLTTIYHKDKDMDWSKLEKIMNDYNNISVVVVGIPLENNKDKNMIYLIKQFANNLKDKYHKEVVFIDEFLTSQQAQSELKEIRQIYNKKTKKLIDAKSAQIILQSWLNEKYLYPSYAIY